MSDIRQLQIANDRVAELDGQSVALEKSLQTLIEKHLAAFLPFRFLAPDDASDGNDGASFPCCYLSLSLNRRKTELGVIAVISGTVGVGISATTCMGSPSGD